MEVLRDKQFCFAGNRFFVLEEMLAAGLNVTHIFAVQNSFLEKELAKRSIPFETIENKKWLVQRLHELPFDYFISNGLPIILPIAKLSEGNSKKFINMHPSYLPDLRGIDPVPGSLYLGRDAGATCHYMNDAIDGGTIIAQVRIPYSEDMDCGLLYQLSFMAEKDAFKAAMAKGFAGEAPQELKGDEVYYNLREDDKVIDLTKDAVSVMRQVRAFNTRSQGAYFMFEGQKVIVRDVELVTNGYLLEQAKHAKENEVVLVYEGRVILKKGNACLKLKQVDGLPATLRAGSILNGK